MKSKNLQFLTVFCFLVSAAAKADQLTHNAVLIKAAKSNIIFFEDGAKQFLISKDSKTGKEIKKLLVWPGVGDGNLNQLSEIKKSKKLQSLILKGSDGDYSFYEVVVWNPENGELALLMSEDSFGLALEYTNDFEVNVIMSPQEDAPDVGSFLIETKAKDKSCENVIAQIKKIDDERVVIIKKSGPIPKGKDSEKLSELSAQKAKLTPHKFNFDLKDFKKIKVSCE